MFKPTEVSTEDKKKGKVEKVKKCIRTAAGISWEDPSLLDWETGECVGPLHGSRPPHGDPTPLL